MATALSDSAFTQAARLSRRGVRVRSLALTLGLLVLLPVLVLLGLAWRYQHASLLGRAEDDLVALAGLTAAGQEQLMEGTFQMLQAVAAAPVVMDGDWDQCNVFLRRMRTQLPAYVSIGVIDTNGALRCNSAPMPKPVHLGDRPYFVQARDGAPFVVGEYVVGRITGNRTLPLAVPVQASAAGPFRVAFVGMDLSVLRGRLPAELLPAGVLARVTDSRGVVLASTAAEPVGVALADEDLVSAIKTGVAGPLETRTAEGETLLHQIAGLTVRGEDALWVVVSAESDELVSPGLNSLAWLGVGLMGLIAACSAALWWAGQRWVIQPLGELAERIHRIRRGAGDERGPPGDGGPVREIGILHRGLEAMWSALERRGRERDAALAEALATRVQMRSVLDRMDDGFMIVDREWRVRYFNRRSAELLETAPSQMDGLPFWNLFSGPDWDKVRESCRTGLDSRRTVACEEFHVGFRRWFEMRFFASDDGIGIFMRDSTQTWEILADLRDSERRYRELFDANPNVMWIFDSETLAFLAVNAAAMRRYGYTEAEFLSMRITDIRPAEDHDEVVKTVLRFGGGGSLGDTPRIWRHLTRSGELMLVDVVSHGLRFRDRPARLVMVVDMTRHVASGSRLRGEVSELTARHEAVSHELAAARAVLDGYVRLTSNEVIPTLRQMSRLSELDAASLKELSDHAAYQTRAIEEALRLTQIGRSGFVRSMVDLSQLASSVVRDLQLSGGGRQVQVEVQPGLACLCDATLARPLLDALLDNAWKFTARQTDAWIRVGEVADPQEKAPTVFVVSDNGTGFDVSQGSRLFTPFTRFHSSTEFPGFGLGLALARAVVTRHGGRIWIESMPGRGTSVYFTLGPDLTASDEGVEIVIDSLPPEPE